MHSTPSSRARPRLARIMKDFSGGSESGTEACLLHFLFLAYLSSVPTRNYGRMARGSNELLKVLPRPAMPDPPTACGRATPKTALRPFQGWPTRRAGGLRPSSTLLDTPCRTPKLGIRDRLEVKTKVTIFSIELMFFSICVVNRISSTRFGVPSQGGLKCVHLGAK
jgi:hypothetical protein